MAITAKISSVKREDGQLVAYCDTDHGQAFSVVLPKASGEFYPLPGDIVTTVESGQEFHAVSVFCKSEGEPDLLSGEQFIFARDEDHSVVSFVHVKADGTVSAGPALNVGEARDFVAMAQKVDTLWSKLWGVFNAWVPVYETSLKSGFLGSFPSTPDTVASKNLKAE